MRRVPLGQTDLRVPAIAFGTWAFGGDWAPPTSRKARTASIAPWSWGSAASTRPRLRVRRRRAAPRPGAAGADPPRGGDHRHQGRLRMDGDRVLRHASRRWLREGRRGQPAQPRARSATSGCPTTTADQLRGAWPPRPREDPAVAVPPVPPRHRADHPPLHRRPRHRRAGVRADGPWPTLGPDDRVHHLRPRRLARQEPDFTGGTFGRDLAMVDRLKGVARARDVSLPVWGPHPEGM